MLDFEKYIDRHGECGVQALIEQIERQDGIRASTDIPLQDRWNALMSDAVPAAYQMAA